MSRRSTPKKLILMLATAILVSLGAVVGPSPARAALPCPCTIWDNSVVPGTPSAADPNAVELGVKFQSDRNGFITGLRFYKGPANTGTHVGHLWTASGTLLSTVTFVGESATGWQQMALPAPVQISANTTYVASYFAPNGGYAVDADYFATSGVTNVPLTALADGADGPNGVYNYFASGFPQSSFNRANYWVDVVFAPFLPSLPAIVAGARNWSMHSALDDAGTNTDFVYGTQPPSLAPFIGDWDGNGTKTPGIFQAGAFKLSNSIGNNPTPVVTFTFGDPKGFPVAGDFNGDGVDDVAVFRLGVWNIRLSTGALLGPFAFGPVGSWPNVWPLAGDWDGDGTDGIGTYTYVSGTWNLRNTADLSATNLAPFVYWAGAGSFPVVGDWDATGTDSVGVKLGTTWSIKNSNMAGLPDDTFDFGAANTFPLAWR